MWLEHLLKNHGLIAVFLGAALEGDMMLVLSGVVAHLGYFPLPAAMVVGAAGSLTSDCLWYALGRWRGPRFRAGAIYRRFGRQVERLAQRLGPWQLLTARFVYGTKNATMVFWGLHGLELRRFLPIDALGCALGTSAFVGLGYLLGGSAQVLLGKAKRIEYLLLGGIVVTLVVLFTIKHVLRKRRIVPPAIDSGPIP
ncbi:MAG: DedA family protein [Gemmatimonadales bacterium]|nr:DedA family protein [Gemmatimonadales bacterium]